MLIIPTFVAPSKVGGNGLFSKRSLLEGEVIWQWTPLSLIEVSDRQLAKMPDQFKEWIRVYGYKPIEKAEKNWWKVNLDDSRFVNHSDDPNIEYIENGKYPEGVYVVRRRIKKGGEILENYHGFARAGCIDFLGLPPIKD